jgi:hypothetical protein
MTTVYKSRKDNKSFEQFPEELQKLKEQFKAMGSKHGQPLSQISVSNYTSKLNKLATIVLGHGWNGKVDWLQNPAKVISALEKSDIKSKKDFISPVVKILKDIPSTKSDIIEQYQKAMASFKDGEQADRNKNKSTKKEKENFMSYPEVLEKIQSFNPTDDMSLIYKLICAMYYQNTLVPRNDLPNMKFVNSSKKAKDLNPEFNYITLKGGIPQDIIMQHYKSRNTYGKQKFEITEPVRKLLIAYMDLYKKKPGDFLFVMRDGQPFKKSNFLNLIGNATEAVIGKRQNVDLIRKIQITHYYSTHVKSIEEDIQDARRYLHGTSMHKEYLKTDLHSSDEED